MSRLTIPNGTFGYTEINPIDIYNNDYSIQNYQALLNKLGRYEDLEEQGLLLELKLKVGDTFWELNDVGLEPVIYPRIAHSLQHIIYCMERLGKITFLTKEDAEEKLKEMK